MIIRLGIGFIGSLKKKRLRLITFEEIGITDWSYMLNLKKMVYGLFIMKLLNPS